MTLSKEIVSFINGMLQQDPNKRLTANQLLNHEFLTKHPSQFQPIDVRQISGTIGPGGVINMKSASTPQVTNYGDNILQLWAIFNQPGMYSGAPSQMPVRQVQQVQPVMQLPTQQQYGGYMNQQQQYYVNSNQVQMMNGYY
jgi:serine/threonine protein kinase